MVQNLLRDLASQVSFDVKADITGLDLIDQVINDPQVLWQKQFFVTLQKLPLDQKEAVLSWFKQMTKVRVLE